MSGRKEWNYEVRVKSTGCWMRFIMGAVDTCHAGIVLKWFSWMALCDGGAVIELQLVEQDPFLYFSEEVPLQSDSFTQAIPYRVYPKTSDRDLLRIHALISMAKRQAREMEK